MGRFTVVFGIAVVLAASSAHAESSLDCCVVIDPWAERGAAAQELLPPAATFDVWDEIIDPWAQAQDLRPISTDQIVDPWSDERPKVTPTAAYPLLE